MKVRFFSWQTLNVVQEVLDKYKLLPFKKTKTKSTNQYSISCEFLDQKCRLILKMRSLRIQIIAQLCSKNCKKVKSLVFLQQLVILLLLLPSSPKISPHLLCFYFTTHIICYMHYCNIEFIYESTVLKKPPVREFSMHFTDNSIMRKSQRREKYKYIFICTFLLTASAA